jgi:hypothetical protein
MAWIESHQELGQHPKLKKAARLLEVPRPNLVGHLHYLWWWALDYCPGGDLTSFDPADIAEAAEWPFDPVMFINALVHCGPGGEPGFLERTDAGRLLIHDWHDYSGRLIEQRERAKANTRRWRERNRPAPPPPEPGPAPVMHNVGVGYDTTLPNTTQPNRTGGDARACAHEAATAPPPRPDLRKPKERERSAIEAHPLFEAITEVFGCPAPSLWGLLGANLHDLDALTATPDDVRRRARRYRLVMGKDDDGVPFPLTLPALIKHWHLCAPLPGGVNGLARAPTTPRPRTAEEGAALRQRIMSGQAVE